MVQESEETPAARLQPALPAVALAWALGRNLPALDRADRWQQGCLRLSSAVESAAACPGDRHSCAAPPAHGEKHQIRCPVEAMVPASTELLALASVELE